jgi:hypothetical protein
MAAMATFWVHNHRESPQRPGPGLARRDERDARDEWDVRGGGTGPRARGAAAGGLGAWVRREGVVQGGPLGRVVG